MTTLHVKPEILNDHMQDTCVDFMKLENPGVSREKLEETLTRVMFPEHLFASMIEEL